MKSTPVCFERFTSEVASLQETIVLEKVHSPQEESISQEENFISKVTLLLYENLIIEETNSKTASLRRKCSHIMEEKKEKVWTRKSFSSKGNHFMETPKEEVQLQQKFCSKRICLMEAEKKEKATPLQESEVHSWSKKFVSQGNHCMEKKKEEASPFKEALLRFRLEPRHRFSSQVP